MPTLLIVDDEYVAVQAITSSVDWERLGITSVYSALNINQAKDVFRNQTVDIALCDIEMPQGNGLDLLRWVRENYPRTECIFLTCHSEFNYAKQAIELGSLDYLLKPVSSEVLEAAVKKAVNKIKNDNEIMEHSQSGYLWDKHKHYVIEHFWIDIFSQKIPSTMKDIKLAAAYRNLDNPEGLIFLPVIIKVKRWHEKMDAYEEKLMEYALKNIAEEIILKENKHGMIIELGQGILVGIIAKAKCTELSVDSIKNDCVVYIKESTKFLSCDLCCYIGKERFIYQMAEEVKRLLDDDKNNVAYLNKVFTTEKVTRSHNSIDLPDMNVWALMLNEKLKDILVDEATGYLNNLINSKELDMNALSKFQQDFIQMVHTFLKQQSIQAHRFFTENESKELFSQATSSVADMIAWINFVVDKSLYYVNETKGQQTAIEKSKKYIAEHIGEELTREDVAAHVFLNPQYLTRLFQKETGLSLPEYVLQERLKIAKELLTKTNMTINTIAAYVGYQNSAHFTRAFKKQTHVNPAEYRSSNKKSQKGIKDIIIE